MGPMFRDFLSKTDPFWAARPRIAFLWKYPPPGPHTSEIRAAHPYLKKKLSAPPPPGCLFNEIMVIDYFFIQNLCTMEKIGKMSSWRRKGVQFCFAENY